MSTANRAMSVSTASDRYDGSILGMGNPLLDISANVPTEFLEKYDLTLNDATIAQQKHLSIDKDLIANYDVQYIAGGATLNTIRVAQWMLRTTGCTTYFGAVGDDANGTMLEQRATEDGVKMILQKNTNSPTGTCAVLITDQGRSLVANLGAAKTFTTAHLESAEAKEAVQKATIVYTSGFFLTVSVEAILQVCKCVVENNKFYAINIPAPFIVRNYSTQLSAVMPYADIVFAAESEILEYGEVNNLGSDVECIAMAINDLPKVNNSRARVVVVTKVSDGTTTVVRGKQIFNYTVDYEHMEGDLVDANGEGDAFIGGFLAQLVQGKGFGACVHAGLWAAEVVFEVRIHLVNHGIDHVRARRIISSTLKEDFSTGGDVEEIENAVRADPEI